MNLKFLSILLASFLILTSNSYARMEELKDCLPCLLLLITENLLTVRTYKDKKQHISRRFMVHWQTQTASLPPPPPPTYPIVGNISAALRLIYIFEWVVYKNATKLVRAWCPCPSAPNIRGRWAVHTLTYIYFPLKWVSKCAKKVSEMESERVLSITIWAPSSSLLLCYFTINETRFNRRQPSGWIECLCVCVQVISANSSQNYTILYDLCTHLTANFVCT